MNKSLTIKITILLVLIVIAVYVLKNKTKSTIDINQKDFRVADTSSIDKIFIAEKNGAKATLEKNEKGVWMINGKYAARMDAVELLLYTFLRIDVKSLAGENAQQTVIANMATMGTKVEVYQQGKRTKIWYIGTATPDNTGTFMVLADPETDQKGEKVFITHIPGFEGFLNTRFFTDENDWRNRNLIALSPDQMSTLTMEYPQFPDSSYQIHVDNIHHFSIATLNKKAFQQADTLAIKQYLAYFMDLSAEAYISNQYDPQIDSIRRTPYFAALSITDKQGGQHQLRFYHKAPDKEKANKANNSVPYDPDYIYVAYNTSNDFALGQYYTFGKIFQSSQYFMPKGVKK